MNSITLSLYTVNPSIITTNSIHRKSNINFGTIWKSHENSLECRAFASLNSSIRDFDLYELLGTDSSSDQTQIKLAYRALQKKCHPDVAGPGGHDT
jgi:DnaJ-domain-containing protein 1